MLKLLFPNLFGSDDHSIRELNTAERLKSLESRTYQKVQNGTDDITTEIQLLEFMLKAQKYQNQLAVKSENSLADVMRFFFELFLIGITCFSIGKFIIAPTKNHCLDNDSQSEYCQLVREKIEYFTGE